MLYQCLNKTNLHPLKERKRKKEKIQLNPTDQTYQLVAQVGKYKENIEPVNINNFNAFYSYLHGILQLSLPTCPDINILTFECFNFLILNFLFQKCTRQDICYSV